MKPSESVAAPQVRKLRLSRVEVHNFGPVRDGRLDLTGATVVLGQQNSGKTYLATLVYDLERSVVPFLNFPIFNGVLETLRKAGLRGAISGDVVRTTLTDRMDEYVAGVENIASGAFTSGFIQSIPAHFLLSAPSDLIYRGERELKISADIALGPNPLGRLDLTLGADSKPTTVVKLNPSTLVGAFPPTAQITVMEQGGQASGLGLIATGAHYVPVERLVVVPAFSQVTNLLLSIYRGLSEPGAPALGIAAGKPLLRQPVFDFLLEINGLLGNTRVYEIPSFGQIRVENRLVSFHDKKHDLLIPIAAAGSGVGQLVGLAILCESASEGLIVAEEPELNLHPDSQLYVSDYLIRVANRRQLLITTHSQFVLAKFALAHSRGLLSGLNAYYIDPDSDSIKPIEVDKPTGEAVLPPSIERAYESIAKEAGPLVKL